MSRPRRKTAKSIIRGVFRTLLLVIIALIIGGNLYTWNAKRVVGNALPMPFGYGVAVVLSGSMEPELSVNDLVIIEETKDIAVDDVIIYQTGSSLVIHRVMSIDGETVITKGDANNVEDDPINISSVKGKLAWSVAGVGSVVNTVRSPFVIILIILLAFLLLELGYRKERKEDEDDLDKLRDEIRKLRDTELKVTSDTPTETAPSPEPQSNVSKDLDIFIDDIKTDIERLETELETNKGGDTNGK